MVTDLTKSILASLGYHSLFGFPLTKAEIQHWLYSYQVSSDQLSSKLARTLRDAVQSGKLQTDGFYYFLPGKKKIVKKRLLKKKISAAKLAGIGFAVKVISLFPWVQMIGLTGNVAMDNADRQDDIDLMIISQANRLWLLRPWVILLLLLLGRKRRPGQKCASNKICLNLWLDQRALVIKRKNCYTAHEILAVRPLYNKNSTYQAFLHANQWAYSFWPNAGTTAMTEGKLSKLRSSRFLSQLNKLAFNIQWYYMKAKVTREKVTLHAAFFHPIDRSQQITSFFRKHLDRV